MATFDPDAYLANKPAKPVVGFDPDAYLAARSSEGIPAGMRRVGPGDIPTESGFIPIPPPPPAPRSLFQKITGYGIETPLVVGSRVLAAPLSMAAIPIGGFTGPLRGQTFEQGVQAGLQNIEKQLYQPRTPEGENVLETFGRVMTALPPIIGTGGIPQLRGAPAATTAGVLTRSVASDLEAVARARENRATAAKVQQSYELGPKRDAAAQGRSLGLVVPPSEIAPTPGARVGTTLAGTARVIETANKANAQKWNAAARQDMRLNPGAKLDAAAFNKARNHPDVAGPYDEVSRVGVLTDPNLNIAVQLENLKSGALIGDEGSAAAVNAWVSRVQDQIAEGVDSRILTPSIRQMRDEATQLYKSSKAGAVVAPEQLALAEAKLGAATALENLLEQNLTDKTLLYRFQKARQEMARTYDYERATNLATGQVDPTALASLAAEGKPLSGNLAKMANFAANFPEVSLPGKNVSIPGVLDVVKRGGVGGVVGSAIGGAMFGLPGYWGGGLLGTAGGGLLSDVIARRQISPSTQAGLANVMDYRLPVNQLTPAAENFNRLLPVQYDWSRATAPNWVPGRGGPQPTFGPEPAPTLPLLGRATAEETMANVQRMRAQDYASAKMQEEAAMRAAQQAPQTRFGQMVNQLAATERRRTEGIPLEYSVGSGKFYPAEPTPAGPVIGVPTALETAVEKISGVMVAPTETRFSRIKKRTPGPQGEQQFYVRGRTVEGPATREPQTFALTAEEQIAWNKATANLAELQPGFKALSDKAIAEKMMDRKWVEETAQKARDKAKAFADIAARAKDEQAKREALANRERMLDTLDALEEQLRAGRPVERGGQGPKTRAAQRESNPSRINMLAPEVEVVNQLITPENVGAGPRLQPGPVGVSMGPSIESRRSPAPVSAPAPAVPTPTSAATPKTATAATKEVVQSMTDAFGYAPDLAAKYANDAAWLSDKILQVEKMLSFELMMEQQGGKPQLYTAKLPRLIQTMKDRLRELQ